MPISSEDLQKSYTEASFTGCQHSIGVKLGQSLDQQTFCKYLMYVKQSTECDRSKSKQERLGAETPETCMPINQLLSHKVVTIITEAQWISTLSQFQSLWFQLIRAELNSSPRGFFLDLGQLWAGEAALLILILMLSFLHLQILFFIPVIHMNEYLFFEHRQVFVYHMALFIAPNMVISNSVQSSEPYLHI